MDLGELIGLLLLRVRQYRLTPGWWQPCYVISIPGLPSQIIIRQDAESLTQLLGFAVSLGLEDFFTDLVASRNALKKRDWVVFWRPEGRLGGDVVKLNTWLYGSSDRPLPDRYRAE